MTTSLFAAYLVLVGITGQPPQQSLRPIERANIKCGIPPIPPIGCQVGGCVCDQSGYNCQWTFNCN
jgi:hypothetical protein